MATISDVARTAGVSTVTVSRVMNEAGNVSPSTRQKVLEAIAELGYVPSGVAQSLRSKRTSSLALMVPDIQNGFWTTVARGVEDAAQSRGYSVSLCNTDENAAKQLHYLDVVISQRVAGVAIAPHDADAGNLAKLKQRNIPTVVIDRHVEGWDVDTVTGDSISGSRALIKHLIDLGHRRIAMISGPTNTSTAADRVVGYRIALMEAGINYDSDLVRVGEFRAISGERLTHQLLNVEQPPDAIFAANNAIAMGVMDALNARGLRIPHDIALVCFDDLPNTSRLFPFLTVVVQPAYDIGANAAQLLLSRLDSEGQLPPRHVVLPTRLIIRHSCGSTLHDPDRPTLSPPLQSQGHEQIYLVKSLTPAEISSVSLGLEDKGSSLPWRLPRISKSDKPDAGRIARTFARSEIDRVAHFELEISSRELLEYVLEREVVMQQAPQEYSRLAPEPEDHIEFAQRLGIDAVPCHFNWYPGGFDDSMSNHVWGGSIREWADLDLLLPGPSLADQLNTLDRYIRAAEGSGVGIFTDFTSFFVGALRILGANEALYFTYDDRPFLERLMDILLEQQERVLQAVCDRFGTDLAFIMVRDELAHQTGPLLNPDILTDIYGERMHQFLAPARAHDIPTVLHTPGQLERILPLIQQIGFHGVHPVAPESNDIFDLMEKWGEHIVFTGNFPISTLLYGSDDDIAAQVSYLCKRLGACGGWIFSTAGGIAEGIPPGAFAKMTQELHLCAAATGDETVSQAMQPLLQASK